MQVKVKAALAGEAQMSERLVDDLRGWWPKLDDGVYDSWRSLALAAQLAHPSPVTRCDIVLNGDRGAQVRARGRTEGYAAGVRPPPAV